MRFDGDLQTPPFCTPATGRDMGLVIALSNTVEAGQYFKDKLGDANLLKGN